MRPRLNRLTLKTWFLRIGLLSILVLAAIVSASLFGSQRIDFSRVFDATLSPNSDRMIFFHARLVRVLMAGLVGAALATGGVAFQALLRNPLAEPFILGVSGGAAMGAVVSIIAGLDFNIGPFSALPFFAFAGAVVTIFGVYAVANVRGQIPRYSLLLVGVIVNAFFGATIMFITSIIDFAKANEIVFWLMGNLGAEDHSYSTLLVVGIYVMLGTGYLMSLTRQFDLMSLGDESAAQLGVEVERLKRRTFLAASFVTAAVVSVAGPIGFVGLIVPHLMRLIMGADHRLLLPSAFLGGAIFMIVTDTLARTLIAPQEIPVGVITVLCGGPFFVLLLKRRHTESYLG